MTGLSAQASAVVAHRLSCSVACEIGPGPELIGPALQDGLFTTVPPGESRDRQSLRWPLKIPYPPGVHTFV